MGTGSSTKRIIPWHNDRTHSENNELSSNFYWACRQGDLETVCNLYGHLTYDQVNKIQPNGSTALHAACASNHPAIVKFLLDHGCCRTTVNNQKKTAYEVAATDTIRILFERPWSDRFVQEQAANVFQVTGRTSMEGAYEAQFMLALGKSSSFFTNIVTKRLDKHHHEELYKLVGECIDSNHREYEKAMNLIEKYRNEMSIHYLLTLYTLETPFYDALKKEADALTAIIYMNLSQLQSRAFQGHTFRGARLTQNDLDAYRWALNQKEKWHENILEIRTFSSTSIEKNCA